MIFVLVGAAAFPLLSCADAFVLRRSAAGKTAAFCLAAALAVCGIVGCIVVSPFLEIPMALRIAGGALGVASLALVTLALLVAVPSLRLYAGSDREQRLITSGLYAMSRHPGVPALGAFLVSLVLLTGSRMLAIATPVWIVLDVGHVIWQERFYLLRVYGEDYRRYQAEVPMLLPTASSFKRGCTSVCARVRATARRSAQSSYESNPEEEGE